MSTIRADGNVAAADRGVAPTQAAVRRTWRTEDWIAVLVGFLVIALVLGVFVWKVADVGQVVSSYRWTTDAQIASMTPGWNEKLDVLAKDAGAKGQTEVVAQTKAIKDALAKGERKEAAAAAAKMAKLGSKTFAGALGAEIRAHAAADASRVVSWDNLSKVLY